MLFRVALPALHALLVLIVQIERHRVCRVRPYRIPLLLQARVAPGVPRGATLRALALKSVYRVLSVLILTMERRSVLRALQESMHQAPAFQPVSNALQARIFPLLVAHPV